MGRFSYQPINYQDYLDNYLKSLKTGELLVDLTNNDIYVTEEGNNIPIPSFQPLREIIINKINKDIEWAKTIKYIKERNIEKLLLQKSEIEQKEQNIFNTYVKSTSELNDYHNRMIYIEKVNNFNVNQLGDLNLNLEQFEKFVQDESSEEFYNLQELKKYINIFNSINNNHTNIVTSNNVDLTNLYNDIQALYTSLSTKLRNYNNFGGAIKLSKLVTTEKIVCDIEWQRIISNDNNLLLQFLTNNKDVDGVKPFNLPVMNGGSNICYPYFTFKESKIGSKKNRGNSIRYYDWDSYDLPNGNINAIPFYKGKYNILINSLNSDGYCDIFNFNDDPYKGSNTTASVASSNKINQPLISNPSYNDSNKDSFFSLNGNNTNNTTSTSGIDVNNYKSKGNTTSCITGTFRDETCSSHTYKYGLIVRIGVAKLINLTTLNTKIYNYNDKDGWK